MPRRPAVTVALALLVPLLWCFGAALFTERCFVYRDAAHYYYPLFHWTAREWAAGRVPLWNPQEECGTPVAADATASVFYPGKVLFALPLPFAVKYKGYIIGHVMLAAGTAFGLARAWGGSTWAAGLCAGAYAFGGSVLFQYCNVVYLVGAAWLPLAALAAERMLARGSLRWAAALGATLALMVLGGDPQTAYHAGALAALLAWLGRRRQLSGEEPRGPAWLRRCLPRSLGLLGVAGCAGVLLSAVQLLPSVEWTRRSHRAVYELPRSLYEVPAYLARGDEDATAASVARGLFRRPVGGTHHDDAYQFSVGPWQLAEFLWPNFYGRQFPENHRWSTALPAEARLWSPSLYLGLLPVLLAWTAWRFRGGDVRVRWLSWCVVLGVGGSLGWYGLGWLVHELRVGLLHAPVDAPLLGQPVGGLYWLLVTLLPGYVYFRYPAKLMVVAALGLSVLAARGFDAVVASQAKRTHYLAGGLAALSVVLLAGTFVVAPWWADWLASAPDDTLLGPLDAWGALGDLRMAVVHSAVIGLVGCVLLAPRLRGRAWTAPALLLLTGLDLAAAHGWLVATAPQSQWETASAVGEQIAAEEARRGGDQPYRFYRGTSTDWQPEAWPVAGAPDRQADGALWDRDTLFPKYQLLTDVSAVESPGSMVAYDYESVLRVGRTYGPTRADDVAEVHPAVRDALGAKYALFPQAYRVRPPSLPVADRERGAPQNTRLWFNPRALPRAWVVHEVTVMAPIPENQPQRVVQRTEAVFFPRGRPRDWRKSAVVETDAGAWRSRQAAARKGSGVVFGQRVSHLERRCPKTTPDPVRRRGSYFVSVATALPGDESARVLRDEPQCVEIEARLTRPGLLVVSDLFASGWTAETATEEPAPPRSVPLWRTNRVMRGVWLPAGTHRVTFRYQPTTFYIGAAVSVFSWLALALVIVPVWKKTQAG